jgi:hypothetical protein
MNQYTFQDALSASIGGAGQAMADATQLSQQLLTTDKITVNRVMAEAEQLESARIAGDKASIEKGKQTPLGKATGNPATDLIQKEIADTMQIIGKLLSTPTGISLTDTSNVSPEELEQQ